ncbi:MAG: ABC transporter ATP-binding protein [Phycisphaerales bacterium]
MTGAQTPTIRPEAITIGDPAAPVAAVRDLSFGYLPGVPVIRSVTAELRRGRVCALIGPNASGKSTLLKLLLGQLTPWAGEVELAGRSVLSVPYQQRAALMSYVPQKGGLSFAFTVRQVVAMGRYAASDQGIKGLAVEHAMALCDLDGLGDRVFAHLSGGQQQRVLLARAVAQARGTGAVMLLDEPASGMDLKHVHQTMRLLRQLSRGGQGGTGLGVLVVLHDVNLAARYADDVWLMGDGELVAAGPCREVMRPELLGPVYGVRFERMIPPDRRAAMHDNQENAGNGTENTERPVFWIDPADTMG